MSKKWNNHGHFGGTGSKDSWGTGWNSGWDDDWDSAAVTTNAVGAKGESKPAAKAYVPCWEENHKPIKILNGEVLGASCSKPADGYDIYIGFEHGMKFRKKNYPWMNKKDSGPIEFLFPITDMSAPSDVKNFKAMIEWSRDQLKDGKKIHVGCIGGHGRTGLYLSALVKVCGIAPKNAIQWVRKHHCSKAVESESQVKFLVKHYDVATAEATKTYASYSGKGGAYTAGSAKGPAVVNAIPSKASIW